MSCCSSAEGPTHMAVVGPNEPSLVSVGGRAAMGWHSEGPQCCGAGATTDAAVAGSRLGGGSWGSGWLRSGRPCPIPACCRGRCRLPSGPEFTPRVLTDAAVTLATPCQKSHGGIGAHTGTGGGY